MVDRYRVDPAQAGPAVAKALERAKVEQTLLTWCTVHGGLQLALRHPAIAPSVRETLEAVVEQLGALLVDRGFISAETMLEAVRREGVYKLKQIPERKP